MGKTGIYKFPDGGLYFGELNEKGLPESHEASCTWANGRSYVGAWVNGTMSGVGTLNDNGKVVYGYWWKGELLHEFNQENPKIPSSPTPHPSSRPTPLPNNKVAALLIGNNNYTDKPLNNCIKDAEAIGEELLQMGANVTILRNAHKSEMKAAIERLSDKASTYENVFFFFSGHGASNHGRHYITAVDESFSETLSLSLEGIDEFLSKTDYQNIILVSDACSTILQGGGNTETPISAGRSLKVFSSSLGSSWDGIPNEHSPFAFGILQYISKPLSVIEIFDEANRFAMAYALNHDFYQKPDLNKDPYFTFDLRLY